MLLPEYSTECGVNMFEVEKALSEVKSISHSGVVTAFGSFG